MSFSTWVQNSINQLAHIGWGAFITVGLAKHFTIFHTILIVVAFALIKEFIFDKLTETIAEQGSDVIDFAFWMVGLALGVLTWIL